MPSPSCEKKFSFLYIDRLDVSKRAATVKEKALQIKPRNVDLRLQY